MEEQAYTHRRSRLCDWVSRRNNLKQHMFTHTCTHCESSFKRKDNLKQHMFWKWLSEKRSFRPILLFTAHCDKATFTRLDNLQQHMFWKWLSEKRGLSATLAISNFGYWKNGDYQQLWLSATLAIWKKRGPVQHVIRSLCQDRHEIDIDEQCMTRQVILVQNLDKNFSTEMVALSCHSKWRCWNLSQLATHHALLQ